MGHNITDSGIDTIRGEDGERGRRVCIAVGLNIEAAAADIYLKWREGGRRRRRRRVRVYRKAETTPKKGRRRRSALRRREGESSPSA